VCGSPYLQSRKTFIASDCSTAKRALFETVRVACVCVFCALVCVSRCLSVCVCVSVCLCVSLYLCVYLCVCICMSLCVSECVCISLCLCACDERGRELCVAALQRLDGPDHASLVQATSTPLRAVSLDRPLMFQAARLLWLRTCCAVAEGADVPLAHSGADPRRGSTLHCPPAVCVAVVLGDSSRRMVALGGREGMPRSLGSVHAGYVTRFLGGSLRGVVSRVIDTPGVASTINGIAVRRDGSALLVANSKGGSNGIHEYVLADASGPQLLVVGKYGSGAVQFKRPHQVWIASDGFVFVTDAENMRVQVLTPQRDFFGYIGVDKLSSPIGVCANAAVVVVSESLVHRISVFRRSDGAFLRRFGCSGHRAGELQYPYGLCFLCRDRYVAVADCYNSRVSVFRLDGYFIRHIGVGVLQRPRGIASSGWDELVVADTKNRRVVVFHASGKVATKMGDGDFRGVAVRGGAIFAQDWEGKKCVVFT
jgi:DNA-binding beta-propeller fold protein YncE